MFTRKWTFAAAACLVLTAVVSGQPATPDARIDALIRKLGSSSFAQREQARKDLEAIGTPALDKLRAVKTTDAETGRRVAELIRLFEGQLLTRQILAPKEVSFKTKDSAVQPAIAELARESGYPIQFLGDATKFADKKVTLEGKLPFWEALDRLCDQAGLMERVDLVPQGAFPGAGDHILTRTAAPAASPGPIVLINRGSEKSLVSYAGAVKTEVRVSRDAGTKDLNLLFIISAEPRLLNHALVGRPMLQKALDDQGRELQPSLDAPKESKTSKEQGLRELERLAAMGAYDYAGLQNPTRRFVQARVKEEHAAMALKELVGTLTLKVDRQDQVLARLDKVMDAAGQSADGVHGGTLKVNSIKKLDSGKVEAQLTLENFGANPFGGNIIINGNGGVIIRGRVQIQGGGIVMGPNGVRINGSGNGGLKDLPDLVDAKGQKFKLTGASNESFVMNNGATSRTATLTYQPNPGQAEPRELILFGTRTYTIDVPFRFENVPLP
jgi:hypothetical protein